MIKVPSHKVSIEVLYETIECLSHDGDTNLKSLAGYVSVSQAYLSSSITTLQMIECFDGGYCLKQEIKSLLDIYPSKKFANELFKEILLKWDPFVLYLSYLTNDYTSAQAIQKIDYFYKIDKKDLLIEIFTKWIKDLNISIEQNNELTLDNPKYFINKYANTLYLCDILSDEIYKFIDKDIKSELIDALNSFNDPEKSVSKSGQALEDFLRIVDKDISTQPSSTNGIAQIANELKGKNIIHQKHNKLCEALGDIRNMAGHGKEKVTLLPWHLTSNSAISYFHMVISLITSLYNYVYHNLQIF